MSELTIASWNVLNDEIALQNGTNLQYDRLSAISDVIRGVKPVAPDTSFLIYLCEISQDKHLDTIAESTGLEVAGRHQYSTVEEQGHTEHSGFLVSPDLKGTSAVHNGANDRTGHLALDIGDRTVFGAHFDYEQTPSAELRRMKAGHGIFEAAYRCNDLILVDTNAMHFSPSRLQFGQHSFNEVHVDDKPKFPTPEYKYSGRPDWYPKVLPFSVSIDAIYTRRPQDITDHGVVITAVSDHPLLWANVKIA